MPGLSPARAMMIYEALNEAVLARVPETARRLLDAGCGTGTLGRKIKEKIDCRVVGLTYSEAEAALLQLTTAIHIAVVDDPVGVGAIRARYAPAGEQIIGHFGTYDRSVTNLLLKSAPALLPEGRAGSVMLLMGHGGREARDELTRRHPELTGRVHATGTLDPRCLSLHLSACDLLVQPYVDGVSSRRTSMMVGLSHGLPIVTTSGRLTESLWAESKAVMLAPVDDVKALAEAAHRLLMDEAARRRLSMAAQALYQQRFDVTRTVTALREAAG